jgi:lysozyme
VIDTLELAFKTVASFEGCRLESYQDIVGVWTIGYGETLNVGPGMVWTQAQADNALKTRLAGFLGRVVGACPQLAQESASRQAACVSLAYNVGATAFATSTVCRMLRARNYQAAADAFLLWNKAGGKVVDGLTKRREAERKLFLS